MVLHEFVCYCNTKTHYDNKLSLSVRGVCGGQAMCEERMFLFIYNYLLLLRRLGLVVDLVDSPPAA